MRVLFTTLALNSHLYNVVPIAWALRTAGHEVVVASQPDLTDTITGAGLTSIPVGAPLNLMETSKDTPGTGEPGYGTGYNIAETDPGKLTWEYVRDTLGTYAFITETGTDQAVLDDLAAFARQWRPDLVIWDAMTYVGPIVARACGAAHARLLFGTDHWARMRDLFLALRAEHPGEADVDPLRDNFTRRLESVGAPAEFSEELVLGQRTIDPIPSWLRVPADVERLPVRPVVYNGPSVVQNWMHERPERPRVCLTLGLTLPEAYNKGFPVTDLLTAAADLDVELVATAGADVFKSLDPSQIPGNVRLVDFVPLNELLPTCSAIIHHGGMGTLQNSLLHGVPQVIVPGWLWDEVGTAAGVEGQGAGLTIDPADFSPDSLRDRVAQVLDDSSFADNAERLRKEVRSLPSPHDLVPELERLAGA